jgi:hypothetical protein
MKGGAGRARVVPDAEDQGVGQFVALLRDEARACQLFRAGFSECSAVRNTTLQNSA